MSVPKTYTSLRRSAEPAPYALVPTTENIPSELGASDVLVKIHAISLNFRDVMQQRGLDPHGVLSQGIPASDAAGEVAAIGSGVKDFKVGDRVSPSFFNNRFTDDDIAPPVGLGGGALGVLTEYGVFEDRTLVHLPAQLSWEEAATIPCAGVTAFNAVNQLQGFTDKSTVLLEGTGGVSSFAMHLLVAAGVHVIVTSSSDEKIASYTKLSPLIKGINYKKHPDIAQEVKRLTGGKGVNLVINTVGNSSIPSCVESLAERGVISLVGALGGMGEKLKEGTLLNLMFKRGTIQGVVVGTTEDHRKLNEFIGQKDVKLSALVDKVFALKEAQKAYDYLGAGKHVGKVIIKV
ncbi:alcohol dehydrogenase zinc-binding domain-containing protein [Colletotrichum higginsianum]|uniref:Alcohol dehydrogenase zinc-binding domain-containing protein n=1 Tax=Colletotrichum higginsianum (strain IMI 349063) TaxID=759273 RepID=H1V9Q5_COLHI|nr:Alcohol dehydrogenase zinc-binding domain-containing protein [Colletotrichum higginsianum IMI 349063]OBR11345.1 Alcohol dehydrogenase zinc-binding domain-containing protein [Colletotrichum higginsianum IMI 349063]CCF36958.1 alcohol dehydrogenase zinc-binding domain-containing protein [Colletotrichum higginsianum]